MTVPPGHPDRDVIATDLVEYIVVSVPDHASMALVVPPIADLVARSAIRILDVVVIAHDVDGGIEVLELDAVDSLAGLRSVEGSYGGFLSRHDIELTSVALAPGSVAIILVAEDRWAGPLAAAAHAAGGQILAGERIARGRVEAALAASEQGEGRSWYEPTDRGT